MLMHLSLKHQWHQWSAILMETLSVSFDISSTKNLFSMLHSICFMLHRICIVFYFFAYVIPEEPNFYDIYQQTCWILHLRKQRRSHKFSKSSDTVFRGITEVYVRRRMTSFKFVDTPFLGTHTVLLFRIVSDASV